MAMILNLIVLRTFLYHTLKVLCTHFIGIDHSLEKMLQGASISAMMLLIIDYEFSD